MSVNLAEETSYLKTTLEKLNDVLKQLETKANKYDEDYRESMKYLWENKSSMDGMEIFFNQKSTAQIVNSGDFIVKKKKKIEKLIESPYFARIDFSANNENKTEKFYIGKYSFTDMDNNMLIYDWRAPISSVYYDFDVGNAFYDAPMGIIEGELKLKRQFKIINSHMEYALESSISISDEVLQKELSNNSDQKMKNIVATIQKEQNKIIRNEKADVLVIQGVAGSGKTSIALHRVAFFLYKYKNRLSAQNIVIISPNKVFADYISNVLPELGEEPISEVGFEDIAMEKLEKGFTFERYSDQIDNLMEKKSQSQEERIKFKASLEFLDRMEQYLNYVNENYFVPEDYTYDNFTISKDYILNRYKAYMNYSIYQRCEEIAIDIVEKFKTESIFVPKIPPKKTVFKALLQMFKFSKAIDLYKDFYQYIGKPEMFVLKSKNTLEYSDVFPFIYIKAFLKGERTNEIKHIVIDEMQDYTPVQYAVINKLYPCRKTILGDFGQAVNQYNAISLQSFGNIFNNVEVVELFKSYRSTYEIIKFAQKIQNQRIEVIERHGEDPKIIECVDIEDEIKLISELASKFKSSGLRTLGILCKTNNDIKKIYEALSKNHDINILDFNSTKFENGINMTTIHMSKGLEFDEVIIPFVNVDLYKSEHDRSLLYVACTRAMHKLILTYSGGISELLDEV